MIDTTYPDALPSHSRLHWYVIDRVLGQGGFGITYLARDTNLDQKVAIKEYLPIEVATRLPDAAIRSRTEDLRDRYRWGLERFIQEARTLAQFDHPNIVRVHSVFEFNNTAYMVMRFEEGSNLASILNRRGTLSEDELLRILLPILDGLERIHNAGFIHRDIKPDNIYVRGDGTPVVLDFGSARQALGVAHTLTILVAPGYAPFEQYYSDSENQGPWTDIYGLGATCYRAIAGRAPLDAISRSKGILGSTQDVLVPASVIGAGRYSGRLLAAIDHALAFSEKDRPQTIAAWRQELVGERANGRVAGLAAEPVPPRNVIPPARTADPTLIPAADSPSAKAAHPPSPQSAGSDTNHSTGTKTRPNWVVAASVGVAVVAVVTGGYIAWMQNDDLRAKLDDLTKQQQRDRAEAERIAKAKNEEALKPKEPEKGTADPGNLLRAEPAPTVEGKRASVETKPAQTPKSEAKAAQPTTRASTPVVPPSAPATVPRREEPAISAPAAPSPPAAAAPDSPKSSPPTRTPEEQIAEADRASAAGRFSEALSLLRPLAEAGNVQAQIRLGDAYSDGRGVASSSSTAAEWYTKAARQGDIATELKLGAIYENGTGAGRNPNLAYVMYGMAARLGSSAGRTSQDRMGALLQPAEREQADNLIESNMARMPTKR